jgi:hypothetical protein
MAITIDPTIPVAGEEVTLSISGATGSTDATRFELTSVPSRSALETGELVDAAGDPVQVFTPDAAGRYTFIAYDYRRFSGLGAFAGDPAGEARDVLVATQTGSVFVADELLLPIAGAGHSLTLRCLVQNGEIAEASLEDSTTEKARLCALDAGVLAAVAALEGEDVDIVGENLITGVVAFIAKYEAHREAVGTEEAKVHNEEDEVNVIAASTIVTQVGAISALNDLDDKLMGHLTTNTGEWHVALDGSNFPITPKSTNVAGATVKLVDLRRVYAAHLATETTVHNYADTDNVNSADSLLTAAIRAVLTFFAAQVPTTPDGESDATLEATARYGFRAAS